MQPTMPTTFQFSFFPIKYRFFPIKFRFLPMQTMQPTMQTIFFPIPTMQPSTMQPSTMPTTIQTKCYPIRTFIQT